MVYSEHFSNHNHQEVKADLQSLIEKQCFETKSDLQNFKQEVGMHFSDEKLIHTIKTLFQNVSGQRDENLCNEKVTPAHDFLTQLILIRCGLERFTKIDSDLGEGSKKGILALKQLYNEKFRPAPMLPIPENNLADIAFFKVAIEIINTTPRPTRLEKPSGIEPATPPVSVPPYFSILQPTSPQQNTEPKSSQETNNKNRYGEILDTGEAITITESAAQKGTIEQFIPEKEYNILLSYENTTSRFKRYTSVKAHRDAKQKTYVVDDPNMPHGSNNRALIYPGTRVIKERTIVTVDKIETHITPLESQKSNLELPTIALKINQEFEYAAQNKRKVQFKPEDVIDACKEYNVPVNYFLAVSRNDSNHGTNGKAWYTKNPGNYGNTDSGRTTKFKTWRDGVFKLAEHLNERILAYKDRYGETTPPIAQLMTGKGPDGNKFFRGVRMTDTNGPKRVQSISNKLEQKGIPKSYIPDEFIT